MSSIRAVGPAIIPAYQPTRAASRTPDSTQTPAVNPVDRVDKLTRQLDATLTSRLAGIRANISPNGTTSTATSPTSRRLDIVA